MNESTRILAIRTNEVLIWHANTGQWKIWFYDRQPLLPQPFTESPQHGTCTSIRLGHVLLWLGKSGNSQLLDWQRATGDYRLFPDIPTNAQDYALRSNTGRSAFGHRIWGKNVVETIGGDKLIQLKEKMSCGTRRAAELCACRDSVCGYGGSDDEDG